MDEPKSGSEQIARLRNEDEVALLEFVFVVWRYRWLIVGLCLATTLITLGMTIRSPKIYDSTATLLTPREGGGGVLFGGLAAASGLLQQLPGVSVPSLTPNRDMLVSILRSRTVAKAVVERFGLEQQYRARYLEDAIHRLQGTTNISISKEGVISIKVEDTDPSRAADIANFYIERVDRLVRQYGVGEAGRQRAFVSDQVARAKVALDAAEESLRGFQERNRAVALQDQTRGAIEAAARLKGEIMAAEVQLQVMRNFATEANPEVVVMRQRVEELRRQLAQMQYGDGVQPSSAAREGRGRRDFTAMALPRVPEIGLELARLTRDVKVHETLVILLTQQLEQAKLAEAKDLPIVQVLDYAVPAVRPSKPRLRLNLAIAGVTSLLGGIFLASVVEYLRNFLRTRGAAQGNSRDRQRLGRYARG